MSFQVAIDSAMYGNRDVTYYVTQDWNNRDTTKNTCSIYVNNGVLGGDPQPGVVKTLRVLVRKFDPTNCINTTSYKVFSGQEGQTVTIDPTAIPTQTNAPMLTPVTGYQTPAAGTQLLSYVVAAEYGPKPSSPSFPDPTTYPGKYANVTSLVYRLQGADLPANNSFNVNNTTMGGDPSSGIGKRLWVILRTFSPWGDTLESTQYSMLTADEGSNMDLIRQYNQP